MARWESDARERLEAAAIELFAVHGFDAVTVPDITAHAGLTTRTFFRHFPDKREVLFADPDRLPDLMRAIVVDAPADLSPREVIIRGIPSLARAFSGDYEQLRQRRAIIESHPGLRERELRKLDEVVAAVADGFVTRGLDEATAALVAGTAVAVVRASLQQWFARGGRPRLAGLMTRSFTRVGDIYG